MKAARKPSSTPPPIGPGIMSVSIDLDPLVDVVRRHVKLTPQASRQIKGEFARLLQQPVIQSQSRKGAAAQTASVQDVVLTTQEAADLVGLSRPYIVARIEAGAIPLHQQVGNQRRVLRSAVLDWQRQEQTRRRTALGRLGADLDGEIFGA